ncbi:uncharacterized protein TM35_000411270 [Trypanosoma theileri]|uniref:CRAL-TRIO domain-containing protein n=1 Tax=Trypanosoma theileri TaxID=67003 RepID=A0A1X0NJE3_9TRYP|nr:uncharacterized protein TM35_000411270 [Trypanosoma theileri]ORC84757.1 hypothetical protein TM35_000411270 [Trypanosoma theileri]
MSSFLDDLGPEAVSHRQEVEEVKRQIGITHSYFDCWVYGFLENKKFNVQETVSKLQRRFDMEINELATYDITDSMRQSLRSGIIQVIGVDKLGRTAFYVTTRRDKPTAAKREESKRTFDMMVSYGTRLREDNKRCQMVMLINQEKASMWSNVDMKFQADIALRIAKFYPGAVDKMYICNMNRTLAAMAKPVFSQLPPIVSERIIIISESDKNSGKLFEYFDPSVLPVELGGNNECDNQEHWTQHATLIEEYYEQLKHAVQDRGLSVKEWELECIRPQRKPSRLISQHSETLISTPLKTCYSDSTHSDASEEDESYNDPELEEYINQWRTVVNTFPRSLAVFFLEELQRWRLAVENEERVAWYALLDEYISVRKTMDMTLLDVNLEDKRWYINVPQPLRPLYRLCLINITILNAIYFIGALIFLVVLVGCILVTLFFGFFVQWNYVFPLGATLMTAAVQGATLCSRALDMVVAIVSRKVIPPFEYIGSHWASTVQIGLFMVLVCIQFIVFCIYAVHESPLYGLKVSFATGWLSAVFIIAFYHVFSFLFDCFNTRKLWRRERKTISFPIFILLNVNNEDDHMDGFYTIRTSSCIICGIPLLLSMLLGTGFLISRIVGFAVATCCASIVAAFTVNYYSEVISNALTANLLRFTLWIACMIWIFDCYAFGFMNYSNVWSVSVILSSLLTAALFFLTLSCLKKDESNLLLRISVLLLFLFLIGCWISSFILIGWKIGVFCFALLAHISISSFCSQSELTNMGGLFLVSVSVFLLLMSCTLLGWYGTSPRITVPRSIPRIIPDIPPTPLEEYHQYPVCSLRTSGGFNITDFALLTTLVNAAGSSAFLEDFTNWFGSTDVTYTGVVLELDSEGDPWYIHQFDSIQHNITVLTLHNKYAFSSIMTLTAWIGSIAISPLGIFLPTEWITTIVYVISFITRMIDFSWINMHEEVTDYLNTFKLTATREVVLTGSGIAGGIASMAGALSQTQTIVFASPGLLHIMRSIGVEKEYYHSYVLAVGADNGVLDDVGGQDDTVKQKLNCDANSITCFSMDYISTELLKSCDTLGRGTTHMISL